MPGGSVQDRVEISGSKESPNSPTSPLGRLRARVLLRQAQLAVKVQRTACPMLGMIDLERRPRPLWQRFVPQLFHVVSVPLASSVRIRCAHVPFHSPQESCLCVPRCRANGRARTSDSFTRPCHTARGVCTTLLRPTRWQNTPMPAMARLLNFQHVPQTRVPPQRPRVRSVHRADVREHEAARRRRHRGLDRRRVSVVSSVPTPGPKRGVRPPADTQR